MSFAEIVAIVRGRWAVAVSAFAAMLFLGLGLTALTPVSYAAETSVFVSTRNDASAAPQQLYDGSSFSSERVKSYADLVQSPRVLVPAVAEMSLPLNWTELADKVEAEAPVETVLVNVRAYDSDPTSAANIANSVGRNLVNTIGELESPGPRLPSPVRAAIVADALPPIAPVWPNWTVSIIAMLVLGAAAAVAAAVAANYLDQSVKSSAELETLSGSPTLATLPVDEETSQRGTGLEKDETKLEPVRKLRANLQFANVDGEVRCVLITSSIPGEGKSLVSLRLAEAMARAGFRTCLVEADLRRPSLAKSVGLPGEVGLTNALIGQLTAAAAMQQVSYNLEVLVSGSIPPNPNELLSSDACRRVLLELRSRYDFVVVDSPPTLPVADAAVLAHLVDGTVFVASASRTKRTQVSSAVQSLRGSEGAPIIGTVLNFVKLKSEEYSKYGYYSSEASSGQMEPAETIETPLRSQRHRNASTRSGKDSTRVR